MVVATKGKQIGLVVDFCNGSIIGVVSDGVFMTNFNMFVVSADITG
tara:strand:+ start:250 stop:387 length:138 start_codon:yes stop_codon:yes gene_type:complete